MFNKILIAMAMVAGLSGPALAATGPSYAGAVADVVRDEEVQNYIVFAKEKYGDDFGMSLSFLTVHSGNMGMVILIGPATYEPNKTADTICYAGWDEKGNYNGALCEPNPDKLR